LKKSRRNRKSTKRKVTVKIEMPPVETQQAQDMAEYQYVITDLKRVAILAAAMFALLIALAIFIR
jgi:hypothetical protein